jgi:hypothetical protein
MHKILLAGHVVAHINEMPRRLCRSVHPTFNQLHAHDSFKCARQPDLIMTFRLKCPPRARVLFFDKQNTSIYKLNYNV